jgi:phosphate:Na+ symporter
MIKNLNQDFRNVKITEALDKEHEINNLRNTFRREHLKSLESGEVPYAIGMVYNDLIASLEKVGDHVINVTEAITGERHGGV